MKTAATPNHALQPTPVAALCSADVDHVTGPARLSLGRSPNFENADCYP
jgi:hypothetical protein